MYQLGRHPIRAFTVGAGLGLAVSTLVTAAPVAQAVVSSCQAQDLTSGSAVSADLQGVIDAASPGDTVQVAGVCVGGFTIGKDLTVVGRATYAVPQATLDGNRESRVLRLIGGRTTDVVLWDLSIAHGRAFAGPGVGSERGNGGGIYIRQGSKVSLNGSTSVTGNTAELAGGGIYTYGTNSAVTLNGSSSVTGNRTVISAGGGIFNSAGTISLNDSSTVSSNRADGHGGGIDNSRGGTATLSGTSSVTGNVADNAGGIFNSGSLRLNGSSSVTGNTADYAGGISNECGTAVTLNGSSSVNGNIASGSAGGISNACGSTVTLNDSSGVSGNFAGIRGGGIYNRYKRSSTVTLNDSSSVFDNTARRGGGVYNFGTTVILNGSASITANTATSGGGGIYNDREGTVRLNDLSSLTANIPDDCVGC